MPINWNPASWYDVQLGTINPTNNVHVPLVSLTDQNGNSAFSGGNPLPVSPTDTVLTGQTVNASTPLVVGPFNGPTTIVFGVQSNAMSSNATFSYSVDNTTYYSMNNNWVTQLTIASSITAPGGQASGISGTQVGVYVITLPAGGYLKISGGGTGNLVLSVRATNGVYPTPLSTGVSIGGSSWNNGISNGGQSAPASLTALTIKSSAGRLYLLHAINPSPTLGVYLKLFNATSVTFGSTSAVLNFYVPPNGSFNVPIPDTGLYFGSGIIAALTANISPTDNTAISTAGYISYAFD